MPNWTFIGGTKEHIKTALSNKKPYSFPEGGDNRYPAESFSERWGHANSYDPRNIRGKDPVYPRSTRRPCTEYAVLAAKLRHRRHLCRRKDSGIMSEMQEA